MSSDPRVAAALTAVAPLRTAYRGAVITALERIRVVLSASQGADRARQQLGAVGASHIDAARFAELSHNTTMDASSRTVIERAAKFLKEIVDAPERDFIVEVPAAERASEVIESTLSHWGRAFSSMAAAELARAGRFDRGEHAALLNPWPFAQWTKAQRASAPPIVATVFGADLRAGDLMELLDGSAHIVLVVEGDCSPAALVPLITPGTFVLQTRDEKGLDRFRAFTGPAIAAMVPDSAATFMHDPANGVEPWQRLVVWSKPENPPRKSLGGLSVAQQQQQMLQLAALATAPSIPIASVDTLAPPEAWDGSATDRLASWLLAQSGDATS